MTKDKESQCRSYLIASQLFYDSTTVAGLDTNLNQHLLDESFERGDLSEADDHVEAGDGLAQLVEAADGRA
jgi:hypothetical protein